jgi:hypothetical protein
MSDAGLTSDDRHLLDDLERVRNVSTSGGINKNDDIVLVDATSGAVSLTLPFASGGKRVIIIRTLGANNVTITPQSGETINGAASVVISSSYAPLRLKALKGIGFIGV